MKRAIPLTLLVLFHLMNYCVTFPLDFKDIDENEDSQPEIVVPRSPSIDGEQTVYLKYSAGQPLKTLNCLVQGTPTPKVIWIRDNNGIEPPLEYFFDTKQGTAVLKFPGETQEPNKRDVQSLPSSTTPKPSSNSSSDVQILKAVDASSSSNNSTDSDSIWDGNYTCVAANFLGRVAKTYIVSFDPTIDNVADEEPEAETTTAISADVEEMTTTSDGLLLQELDDANQTPQITTEANGEAVETTTLESDTQIQTGNGTKPAGSPDATVAKQENETTATAASTKTNEITSTSSTTPPIVYVFAKTTSPGSTEYLLGSASSNVSGRFTRYSNRRSSNSKNRRRVSSR